MCVGRGGGGDFTEQFTRDLQRLCSCSKLLICASVNEEISVLFLMPSVSVLILVVLLHYHFDGLQ